MSLNNPICNHTLWCLSISFLTSHSQAHASPAELPNSSEVRLRKTASHTGSLSSAKPCDWTEFTFHLQEARLTPMACQKNEVKSGLPECVRGNTVCWNSVLDRQMLSPFILQSKICESRDQSAPCSFTQIQNRSRRTMRFLFYTIVQNWVFFFL